jgi:hypothetical protein
LTKNAGFGAAVKPPFGEDRLMASDPALAVNQSHILLADPNIGLTLIL